MTSAHDAWFSSVKKWTELPGPVGMEDRIIKALQAKWNSYCLEIGCDQIGNLIAHFGGNGPKLLLTAHADEICLIVKSISSDGYLWVTTGQMDMTAKPTRSIGFNIAGQPCLVVTDTGTVEGLIATVSGHVMTAAQRAETNVEWHHYFVDIGATCATEVQELGINVGDRVIWNPPTRTIGHYITGKAMDDRASIAILDRFVTEANPKDLTFDVYIAITVQEEIGLIGVGSVANHHYSQALVLEVGLSGDIPSVEHRDMPVVLGSGPILVHKDYGASYDRAIIRRMKSVAETNKLPVQHAVFSAYGTDGIVLTQRGIPTAVLAFPARYTHSPFETICAGDLEIMYQLLVAYTTHA